jgi:predicted phosphodiesterase
VQVAALFDVHGNLPALDAVLAEPAVAHADLVLCGGDVVPGPFPSESLELLLDLGERLLAVHGNGEREVLARASDEASWCAGRLTDDQLRWLRSMPATAHVPVGDVGDVLLCHATPGSDEEIVTLVTPDERLAAILGGVQADVVLAGHTHSQLDRTVGGVRFVNAGSVGTPYELEPGARWALMGPDVELRRTEYDPGAAAERIRASGYPLADAFAVEYVLSRVPPEEAARHFEALAERGPQSANSEKYR